MFIYARRSMLAMLFLGFSSGLPLALTGSTLQAWMTTEKVDLKTIGLFSLVGLPYTLKFLWAPLLDYVKLPWLDRRRSWMVAVQAFIAIALFFMSALHPSSQLKLFAVLALVIAFLSATQDIVIDAYRVDLLASEERGAGAAASTLGYRLAMLASGAGALILATHFEWMNVYQLMALGMIAMMAVTFFAPKLESARSPASFKEAVVEPFIEFFSRKGVFEVLLFTLIYKLDVVLALALNTPFLLSLGFTLTEVAVVHKGVGLAATLMGTLVGGIWMQRLGLYRSLWVFGSLQAISSFLFLALAHTGKNHALMVSAIAVENGCSGMGNAAYAAFLMSLCNKKFTAFQYALLSSLMAVTRVFVAAPSGYLAESTGWVGYFFVCILAGIPGLLLLFRFNRWQLSK